VFFAPQFWSSAVVVWSQMRRPRDSAMSALATVAGGRPERVLAITVIQGLQAAIEEALSTELST